MEDCDSLSRNDGSERACAQSEKRNKVVTLTMLSMNRGEAIRSGYLLKCRTTV